jgi:molecular chaperone GrpE
MAEEKDLNEQEEVGKELEQDLAEPKTETQETSKELSAEEKYAELNDRYLRLFADFDNLRKRSIKEKADLISNANAGVLSDLLIVLDDFERAIANNENAAELEVVKDGFNLIYHKFKGILESKGLKPMICKGMDFDSELHEAIANVPAPSEDEKGKVIDDVTKGYYLHDKVLRYAKVVVGQ